MTAKLAGEALGVYGLGFVGWPFVCGCTDWGSWVGLSSVGVCGVGVRGLGFRV